MSNTLTLITNISFVTLQSPVHMRLECHALLICPPDEDGSSLRKALPELRGYAEEASGSIFSMTLETMEYTLADAHDPTKIFMGEKTGMRPLFSGALLKIDKYEFFLQAEDYEKPLSIETFERPSRKTVSAEAYTEIHSAFYEKLWGTLHKRAAQFWNAPYFPVRKYMPVELVRLSLEQANVLESMSRHDLIRAMWAIEVLRHRDDATLAQINDALRGLQSTDEPALSGFSEELRAMKTKLLAKDKAPSQES